MKVVAFIPIKMNNERLPGKNTKKLDDGRPLCDLVFNTVTKVKNIDECYCFCSNEEIKRYIPGKIKYLKRDNKLDSSATSINEIINSFIEKVDSDYYVLLHITAPFIKESTIEECVNAVTSKNFDSALSVNKLKDFLWNENGPVNFDPSNIKRTQDLETLYRETSGVYVFSKELFEKHSRRVGFKPYLRNIGAIESMDIDYPEDFEIANAIYMKMKNTIER
jgi:CMP-N-acetylneuraminic acid synthetase